MDVGNSYGDNLWCTYTSYYYESVNRGYVLHISIQYFRDSDSSPIINLPSFLDALSSILQQLGDSGLSAEITILASIERLVVLLMERLPTLHHKLHYVCYLSILRTLLTVRKVQVSVFNTFLSQIGKLPALQLILWTLIKNLQAVFLVYVKCLSTYSC